MVHYTTKNYIKLERKIFTMIFVTIVIGSKKSSVGVCMEVT